MDMLGLAQFVAECMTLFTLEPIASPLSQDDLLSLVILPTLAPDGCPLLSLTGTVPPVSLMAL